MAPEKKHDTPTTLLPQKNTTQPKPRRSSSLKLFSKKSKTAGLLPGTLIFVGDEQTDDITISTIDFAEDYYHEKEKTPLSECIPDTDTDSITWTSVEGIHKPDIIEDIGKQFGLHPLILEDIVNTGQRAKLEDYGDYIFLLTNVFFLDPTENRIKSEQISIVFSHNYVLTFQELRHDIFAPIKDRIRNAKGRIRERGADYLAYSLLDCIVDQYYLILETIGDRIEQLEHQLNDDPEDETLTSIRDLKRETIMLRRNIWPLREVLIGLKRMENSLVQKYTAVYLKDVYDHTVEIIDTVDTFHEITTGMLELYSLYVSNKTNDVMKVLTIITTLFIPLTFLTGLYGMNFKHMPELNWPYSYPILLALIATIFFSMIYYFKSRKWI